MTVSPGVSRADYIGNGVTTTYDVPFQFFEIIVFLNNFEVINGTDYTITQTSPGMPGSVTFTTAPGNGVPVSIQGNTVIKQDVDLTDEDAFPADTIERAFDRLTMISKDLATLFATTKDAETSAIEAAASGAAAITSAAAAHASEVNAAASQSAAAASATLASGAATSAGNSATSASTSAGNAAASATSANTSELAAATSETNAENSATAAANSATAANTSKTNAATSETNAAASATSAANSATAANTSKTNAATSETNAAASASAAASSASTAATAAASIVSPGGALVGTTAAQTMTNKTLVRPAFQGDGTHTIQDFTLGPRTQVTSVAVPTLRAKTANSPTAFDVCPNGSPAESAGNGFAWADICDSDVLDTNAAVTAARVAMSSASANFDSVAFVGATPKKLSFGINNNGTRVEHASIDPTSGRFSYKNRAAFRAHKSAAQTGIPSGAFTNVTFDVEDYDIGNCFASNAWTPPAGLVHISARALLTLTKAAGGLVALKIFKNGTTSVAVGYAYGANTSSDGVSVECFDVANGSDAYTVQVFANTSSGTVSVDGAVQNTLFGGTWLGLNS